MIKTQGSPSDPNHLLGRLGLAGLGKALAASTVVLVMLGAGLPARLQAADWPGSLSPGWSPTLSLGDQSRYLGPQAKGKPFTHFQYTDPEAQPGGVLRLAAMGSFDKLNPFTLKGSQARGLLDLVFEPLAIASLDEPSMVYGLLAKEMKLAPDGLSVSFRLNPDARFSNGKPVLAQDVKFSFDTLRSKLASPVWRSYWADVRDAEILDERTIRFNFLRRNRELHMTVASLPVFSADWGGKAPFHEWVLQNPIGSGPYRVGRFDLGKFIEFDRRTDYWAAQHPTRRHQFNHDRISFRYYKDVFARLEAFKAGEFDFIAENTAKNWARSYIGRGFDDGSLIKAELPNSNSAGMQAFVFNTRKPIFQDVRVRQAVALALDFEWMNRQLFYNQYRRTNSFFTNTDLAARGEPSKAERRLMESIASRTGKPLQPALLGPVPEPPKTTEPESLRENLRLARSLLAQAGWTLDGGVLKNAKGQRFEFELLMDARSWERIAAPFARNLQKLGIRLNTRVTDSSLFKKRVDAYDYDMIVHWYLSSQSPGNELAFRFTSRSANVPGEDNYAGVRDPHVDAAIAEVLSARSRDELEVACQVLDRFLRHGHYVVPHWHNRVHRVAYREGIQLPKTTPLYYGGEEWSMASSWWRDPARRQERLSP